MRTHHKSRKLNDIRFSPEIEVEFKNEKISTDLINKHRIIKGWDIKVENGLMKGAEYIPKNSNKLFFNSDSKDQIKEILAIIKVHKGFVTNKCGLHCHIDAKSFTSQEIVNIVKAFIKKQKDIYIKFKVYRRREKRHAEKIPNIIYDIINKDIVDSIRRGNPINLNSDYFISRFWGLNLQSLNAHNSIEFRFANGEIKFNKIIRVIKFCIEFCLKYANKKV